VHSLRSQALRAKHLRSVGPLLARRRPLFALPFKIAVVAILASSGFPVWRTAVVAGLIALSLSMALLETHCVKRQGGPHEWSLFASQIAHFFPYAAVLACTGGLASPLLPLLVPFVVFTLALFGPGPQSVVSAALVGLTALGLGMMPEAWRGPPLPYSAHGELATLTVLYATVALAHGMGVIGEAHRQANACLSETRDAVAEEAQRRARSLETIGAKLAHELKNPLAAIKGLAQLLEKGEGEGPARKRLGVIRSEASRMEAILADYLSFSRPLECLTPGPVDLGRLVDEALEALEARAADVGVRLSRSGPSATVEGDGRRLKEALLHLVKNAIEASPKNGSVDVHVEPCDDGAEVTIRDRGCGIAPHDLPRIGTPFFSTRAEGSGLGVVLARAAVRQHGGELCFASEAGAGTSVTMRLPRRPAAGCEGVDGTYLVGRR
jgi:signal transduction histidine kinase